MTEIASSTLRARVREIVASSDHNTLTVKGIRLRLETEFGVKLLDRKAEIQELVDVCLVEAAGEDQTTNADHEADANSTLDGVTSGGNGVVRDGGEPNDEIGDSESDAVGDNGANSYSDSDSHDLQETSAKRAKANVGGSKSKAKVKVDAAATEEDDAEVARRLSISDVYGLRRTRAAAPTAKRKSVPARREPGERSTSGFQKPVLVSEQLAALVGGERELSRPEIVKRLWSVVKERNLLDARNRQFAVCDAQLTELFGRARVRMFGMMKLLKKHITPI